jgi:hypothetical protein
MIDANQKQPKKCMKNENFSRKVLVVQKKSRTFAPANQEHHLTSKQKERVL